MTNFDKSNLPAKKWAQTGQYNTIKKINNSRSGERWPGECRVVFREQNLLLFIF
jgi:hypothetical protein